MKWGTPGAWIQASRPPFFIATLVPIVTGWLLGTDGGWHVWWFFVVIFGSLVVHLATNLANDYFEHAVGTDDGESIGGSRVIQQGKISPGAILTVVVLLYVIAFIIAFYIIIQHNMLMLFPFILFAFFSSLFYVAPPVRYGYHGLGELLVGINMGPLMVVGTRWVIAGSPDWRSFFISLPIGLMVASKLYYQSLPDMRTDALAGKRTLAVRLGRNGAFAGLVVFWVLIYLGIILLVAGGLLSAAGLVSLASIPILVRLIRIVKRTDDWVLLDRYGSYVRILYFFNGLVIVAGIVL